MEALITARTVIEAESMMMKNVVAVDLTVPLRFVEARVLGVCPHVGHPLRPEVLQKAVKKNDLQHPEACRRHVAELLCLDPPLLVIRTLMCKYSNVAAFTPEIICSDIAWYDEYDECCN